MLEFVRLRVPRDCHPAQATMRGILGLADIGPQVGWRAALAMLMVCDIFDRFQCFYIVDN